MKDLFLTSECLQSRDTILLKGKDTKIYKEDIKKLGGKWNSSLCGWIFTLNKKDEINQWINTVSNIPNNTQSSVSNMGDIEGEDKVIIQKYSEKSFVVRGQTFNHMDKLKELGGKWNAYLKGGEGWIFPNYKENEVKEYFKYRA